MKKLLELRQQKAALKAQMRSILDKADSEKRSLNDEEGKQFDELRAQADALETEITRQEAVAEDQRNLPGTSVEGKSVSNDELRHYIITGDTRALSTLVQADGGFTVIPELDKEIMRQLSDESVMRQISTVKTISSNEYKKLVSVGGATVKHGEEGQPRTETSTPKLEEVSIKLFPIYAYPKTTQEILDFSDVDILGWLSSEISDTFTETEETDLLEGDGNKKARGFLDYPRAATSDKTRPFGTLEKMETAGAAPTADELIDLLFKLKSKYRKNAVWVMNSGSAAALQKLKNGIWDEFREQFAPGAFKDSLASGTDVRALYEHNYSQLLGRTKSGTLVLSEDDTGLRFELTPPNTQLGNDVLELVERGDISGMSFGFRALKESWNIAQSPYLRTVTAAELREITVTSMPAYPESGVEIAHRSLFSQHPELRRAGDNRRRWAELAGL